MPVCESRNEVQRGGHCCYPLSGHSIEAVSRSVVCDLGSCKQLALLSRVLWPHSPIVSVARLGYQALLPTTVCCPAPTACPQQVLKFGAMSANIVTEGVLCPDAHQVPFSSALSSTCRCSSMAPCPPTPRLTQRCSLSAACLASPHNSCRCSSLAPCPPTL